MPRYSRTKRGKLRSEPSAHDPPKGGADFYRRLQRGKHQEKAVARRNSAMAYTPPGYDPEGGEFAPIKPGVHGGAVEVLELKYGQESQEPYVAWTFVLIEGEFKSRKVWNNTSLKESAINMPTGFYKSIIAAMGEEDGNALVTEIQAVEFDDEESMAEWVAERVVGRLVDLLVANRKYQGRVQNDVEGIRAYTGETPQLDTQEMVATGAKPGKRGKTKAPAKATGKPGKAAAKDDMGF
jgi:hypothetical protein